MPNGLKVALCQGIVDRNIAIVPWSILLEDRLLAMEALRALVALALVVQPVVVEAMVELLEEALVVKPALASVAGREVQHHHT